MVNHIRKNLVVGLPALYYNLTLLILSTCPSTDPTRWSPVFAVASSWSEGRPTNEPVRHEKQPGRDAGCPRAAPLSPVVEVRL